jgi:hypothetical protein
MIVNHPNPQEDYKYLDNEKLHAWVYSLMEDKVGPTLLSYGVFVCVAVIILQANQPVTPFPVQ